VVTSLTDAPAIAIAIDVAVAADIPVLETLIAASARALSRGFYTAAETEAAIANVFGVDSDLIEDGSYLIARLDGELAGCGGWSARRTLFGGDRFAARETGRLDPGSDAARIRAFFVAPGFARRGVGAALLAACEAAAAAAGFTRTALMATLPGIPLYRRHGYIAAPPTVLDLGGIPVEFVPMNKNLLQ
jgi:GNAT superfamily N-acetyltransferase